MNTLLRSLVCLLTCAVGLTLNSAVSAQIVFDVEVNTAPLIDHPAGPFFLAYKLTDGSGLNDGNNTVIINEFNFAQGQPEDVPQLIGNAKGNLSASVTLTDTQFLNEFVQQFTPGDDLFFRVQMTTNIDKGTVPDEFAFKILDCMGDEIPTIGLGDSLLIADITSGSPVIQTFASDPLRAPSCGGDVFSPQIVARAVPEPGSLTYLYGLCVPGLLLAMRTRAGRHGRQQT